MAIARRRSRQAEASPSGERESSLAGDVVGLVDATDPAAARVAAGQRLEVEPGFGARMTDRLQAAAALGTRDRRGPAVTNGEHRAKLGIGRVDHLGFLGGSG
jgi:hypothetical protein